MHRRPLEALRRMHGRDDDVVLVEVRRPGVRRRVETGGSSVSLRQPPGEVVARFGGGRQPLEIAEPSFGVRVPLLDEGPEHPEDGSRTTVGSPHEPRGRASRVWVRATRAFGGAEATALRPLVPGSRVGGVHGGDQRAGPRRARPPRAGGAPGTRRCRRPGSRARRIDGEEVLHVRGLEEAQPAVLAVTGSRRAPSSSSMRSLWWPARTRTAWLAQREALACASRIALDDRPGLAGGVVAAHEHGPPPARRGAPQDHRSPVPGRPHRVGQIEDRLV